MKNREAFAFGHNGPDSIGCPQNNLALTLTFASTQYLEDIVYIESSCFSNPWDRASILSELESVNWSRTIIALMESQPAGYISFWTIAGEYQVLKVAVHPRFQRRGIGREMVAYLLQLARYEEISLVTLEFRAENTAARKLYHSCGFIEDGIRKGYYTDTGEDAILMHCSTERNS